MKIATYCRISTDEVRQPYSLDAQADRLDSYVKSQDGWSLVHKYIDQKSGKGTDRPGLQQALQEARDGRYELLLVYKVDRLSRSISGLVRILEDLNLAGVGFRSASEPFDTSTAAGRMMVQLLGVFAEFEREMIVERTKMGLAKKAAKGEWTGGVPPFGYSYDIESQLLLHDSDEASVVRTIFERYVAGAEGSMSIARWLNEKAELTRRGAKWTPKKVLEVLRNPTYIGSLPFRDTVYAASHEPIVDEELFNSAKQLLQDRRELLGTRRNNSTDYVLTPFLKCTKCGHGFIGTVSHGKGGAYRYYACFSRRRHGATSCDQDWLPAEQLEEKIFEVVLAELADGSIFSEAAARAKLEWQAQHAGADSELKRLQTKVRQRRAAIDRYLKSFEAGQLPETVCSYRVREIEAELSILEAEIATLEFRLGPASHSPSLLDDLRQGIARSIRNGTPQQVKQLLAGVIDSIDVESKAFIQPYYFLPGVRVVFPQRRRTGIEPAHRLSSAHQF